MLWGYEARFIEAKHNRSSVLIRPMRIGFPSRGTWRDFLKQITEQEVRTREGWAVQDLLQGTASRLHRYMDVSKDIIWTIWHISSNKDRTRIHLKEYERYNSLPSTNQETLGSSRGIRSMTLIDMAQILCLRSSRDRMMLSFWSSSSSKRYLTVVDGDLKSGSHHWFFEVPSC